MYVELQNQNKEIRRHFEEYNDICNRVREMQYKIFLLKERLYSISGVKYDDIPKSTATPQNDIVYRLQEIEDLMQEYEDLREQERLKVREHLAEINQVPNETWRSILRSYYLHHMSIQEIADMLQKTPNHVSKLKGQATNMFYLVITKK